MKLIKGFIFNILVPFLVLFFLFKMNFFLGFAGITGFIGYLVYKSRESLYSLIGKTKYSKGDIDGAIKWFRKAAALPSPKTGSITSYAYLLLKNGDTETSSKIIDRFMNKNYPEDEKMLAKSIRALITWKEGNLEQSIEMLEDVLSKIETSNIYGSLGYMYILQGDLKKALDFNLKAYDYNSNHDVILDNLGQNYFLMEEYEKALEIYEKLMGKSIKPSFAEGYYNYGQVLQKLGQKEKALESFKKALDYKITFLSTIASDQIYKKIDELSN